MGKTYRREPKRRISPDWDARRQRYKAGREAFGSYWEAQAFIDTSAFDSND